MIKALQLLFRFRRWLAGYGLNLNTQIINGSLADGRPVMIMWPKGDVHLHDDYPTRGYVKMYTMSKVAVDDNA